MKNLPSLYELLAHEKEVYDKRRKSARAFHKFYGTRNVRQEEVGTPAGDYYFIDGIECLATHYSLFDYRVFLIPLINGPQFVINF